MEQAEAYYGRSIGDSSEYEDLVALERQYGRRVHRWLDEGMPLDAMGTPSKMRRFRERTDSEIPWNIEEFNRDSLDENTDPVFRKRRRGPDGDTGVPDSVREVIASPGRSLDPAVQRAVEERTGESFGNVRIHTGAKAAAAADAIDARAFTVGNHVAFGAGEYDPESAEGQHVLVHELAHVRQQTGGVVSMLPAESEVRVSPDTVAAGPNDSVDHRVAPGSALGIGELSDTPIHVQRRKSTDELHDELDEEQVDRIESIVEEADGYETVAEYLTQLAGQLAGLNHKLQSKDKVDEAISGRDIVLIAHGERNRPHYLLQTDKWSQTVDLAGDGMYDLKHIVARHGNPDSEAEWPVPPGCEDHVPNEEFPAEWGPEELIAVIGRAIESGRVGRNAGRLIYSPSDSNSGEVEQLNPSFDQYHFDEVLLHRNPESGVVQSLFPILEGDE